MRLDDYLGRIGYEGARNADLETLTGVHRAHLLAVPYENLDVASAMPVTRDAAAAFDKIVTRRRGGWCYEMNGLLGWALEEIGFSVTHLAGGVRRAERGDEAIGNHLVLRVDLDRPYIADAGFGDGLLEPVPLEAGEYTQRGFTFRLEKLDPHWWRFHNHLHGAAPSFDFTENAADPALLERQSLFLQQPQSRFATDIILQKHTPHGIATLRNRTLRLIDQNGVTLRELDDERAFVQTLKTIFDLELGDSAALWRKAYL